MQQRKRGSRIILGLLVLGVLAGAALMASPAQAAPMIDTFPLRLTIKEWCRGNPKFFESGTVHVNRNNLHNNLFVTITRASLNTGDLTNIEATINTQGGSAEIDSMVLKGRAFPSNKSGSTAKIILLGTLNNGHFFSIRGQATFDKFHNLTKVTGTFSFQITDTYAIGHQGGQSTPVDCFGSGTFGTGQKPSTLIGQLGGPVSYPTRDLSIAQTVIGDLNGDGRNDVATFEWVSGQHRVLIYYQDSSGGLSTIVPFNPYEHDLQTARLTIGDLNNDGKLDLVLTGQCVSCNQGPLGKFMVLYQDPQSGHLNPGPLVSVSAISAGHAAIGDINSDGRADLVIVNAEGHLSIFYQTLTGDLGQESVYEKNPVFFMGAVRIADMDNDGDNDIVIQSDLKQLAIIKQDSTVNPGVFSGTPDYYSVQTSYWPQIYTFEVGDLNGDGRIDVLTNDPGNNGYLNIFLQNTSGTLDPPILVTVLIGPLSGIEIVDVTGDGLNDIAGDGSGSVYMFRQKANHSFADPIAYTTPTNSGGGSPEYDALSFGDVTGDGIPDAVVTWWTDKLLVVLRGVTLPE